MLMGMLLYATEAVFWFLAFHHGSQGLPELQAWESVLKTEKNTFCCFARVVTKMLVNIWIINDNKMVAFPYKRDLLKKASGDNSLRVCFHNLKHTMGRLTPKASPWPFWRDRRIPNTRSNKPWNIVSRKDVPLKLWIYLLYSLVFFSCCGPLFWRIHLLRSAWNSIHNPFCFYNMKQSNRIESVGSAWLYLWGIDWVVKMNTDLLDGEWTESWSGIAADMNHAQ